MKEYDALIEPESEKWLKLSEENRIAIIESYVRNHEKTIEEEAFLLHSSIHMVVENQLAENIESTKEAYNRLLRQGLNRHEAIHAIGAVVTEDIYDMLKNKKTFNHEKYKNRLRKLTAKKWKKGKY